MSKKERKLLVRICTSLFFFVLLLIAEKTSVLGGIKTPWVVQAIIIVLASVSYLIAGYDVILKAAVNICHGQVFDESFLMMIATYGAFFIGETVEAVAVMIFFQVGELFETIAVGKSRASIKEMMEIAPEYANLLKNGEIKKVDPEEVQVGDSILVLPGERIPLDGVVLDGSSHVDTSSLTGEPVPRSVHRGESVVSGCINQNANLIIQVTELYENSTVAKVLELVENAANKKARTEHFITRFAHYYTPAVTLGAVLLALIPPLFFQGDWNEWIRRACTFLVISCPCALVISVPLGFFGGIGAASRLGVLVKGSNYLELLAQVRTLVFDKTGTLTRGTFSVTRVYPADGIEEQELLKKAALMESFSTHPIALALQQAYSGEKDLNSVSSIEEIPGKGLKALVEGKKTLVGNGKLLTGEGIAFQAPEEAGTVIYVSQEGKYLGAILISDEIKENARKALEALKETGITETVLLTGDHADAAVQVQKELGIHTCFADLLPQEKVEKLEEILKKNQAINSKRNKVAFVGDGINDAPVLMRSDLGIAMGHLGSDAAIEAADIVLMDDNIEKIAKTVRIAEKTLRIVKENIIVSLAIKFSVLILGALGLASMWLALFADVGVMVLAVLNSTRMVFMKKEQE